MEYVALLVFVAFVITIAVAQAKSHKRRITEKISSIGGEIISIERKIFSTGPFSRVRRGRTVYRIEYKKENEVKEGWVKFGDLYGPEWRL